MDHETIILVALYEHGTGHRRGWVLGIPSLRRLKFTGTRKPTRQLLRAHELLLPTDEITMARVFPTVEEAHEACSRLVDYSGRVVTRSVECLCQNRKLFQDWKRYYVPHPRKPRSTDADPVDG